VKNNIRVLCVADVRGMQLLNTALPESMADD